MTYKAGVSYIDIKKQGCWLSSSFWYYITNTAHSESTICAAFYAATKNV